MSRAKKGAEWTEGSGPEPVSMKAVREEREAREREAALRAANLTRFGTTPAEELELYRKWCMGYPDNRKHVP